MLFVCLVWLRLGTGSLCTLCRKCLQSGSAVTDCRTLASWRNRSKRNGAAPRLRASEGAAMNEINCHREQCFDTLHSVSSNLTACELGLLCSGEHMTGDRMNLVNCSLCYD